MPPFINRNRAERTNNTNQQTNANRPRNTEPGLFVRVVAIIGQEFAAEIARLPLSGELRRIGQALVRPDDFYRFFVHDTPLPPPECWRIPGRLARELRNLDVSRQQLTMLPDHLPPNLRILNASQNGLQTLPNKLPHNLVDLVVWGNQLYALPNNLPHNLVNLYVWGNQLYALPYNLPQNLQMINASYNRFSSLPNFLPPNLLCLDVSHNQLSTLPNELPPNLTSLKVSGNRLQTLPNSLPPNLISLEVSGNRLQTLPNSLPPNLAFLDVSGNQLQTLPNPLPPRLSYLDVKKNQLREVEVDLFAQLNSLREANISHNPLSEQTVEHLRAREATRNDRTLKITFEPLSAVNMQPTPPAGRDAEAELAIARIRQSAEQMGLLDLQGTTRPLDRNDVVSIMNELLTIPILEIRSTELLARTLGLCEEILTMISLLEEGPDGQLQLPALTERPHPPAALVPAEVAADPTLYVRDLMRRAEALANFGQEEQQRPIVPVELGQAVTRWVTPPTKTNIAAATRLWQGFADEPCANFFAQFLERLGKTVNSKDPHFRASVAEWLSHLENRTSLRQATFSVCAGASDTCEDRVSLSFNTMQALRLASDVAQGNYDDRLPDLINLARGMFRLDELARIAAKTTQTLQKTMAPRNGLVEEIEVYLAYQVKLRESLALPINTPKMRFSDTAYLTQTDLDKAEQHVKQAERDNFANYLSSEWQPWQEVLQRLAPQKHAQAKDALIEAMGDEFARRLQTRLQTTGLTNDPDAERTLGAQVRADIAQELYGQLTRDFLANKGMLNLLR